MSDSPLDAFLRNRPASPNASPDLLRRARLVGRAARRFLDPPRPRLAEARAFFASAVDGGPRALAGRWEAAADAGLIPAGWATDPPFLFHREVREVRGRWERSQTPQSVGAAVAFAASAAHLPAVIEIASALARFEYEWGTAAAFDERRGRRGPWASDRVAWAEVSRGSLRLDSAELRNVRHAMPKSAVPGERCGAPRAEASPRLESYSRARAADLVRDAFAFDFARANDFHRFRDVPPGAPNPVDLRLELWAAGYTWLGYRGYRGWLEDTSWHLPNIGEEDSGAWTVGFRPDDGVDPERT